MAFDDFAAITCYFNPVNYENRRVNYFRYAESLDQQGVSHWTIEAALPGEEFTIPKTDQVIQIRLPEDGWLWQKERLLNLLIKQLPSHITKVAWLDCDILFHQDNWAEMACEALDNYPVVQLFDYVLWLGPDDEVLEWKPGADKKPGQAIVAQHYPDKTSNFNIGALGFAWAATRDLLDKHGLYENDITGGGDSGLAVAYYGLFDHWYTKAATGAMKQDIVQYAEKLFEDVQGKVGYIPTHISHLWHGSLTDRAYRTRRETVAKLQYFPYRDTIIDPETQLLKWSETANKELKEYVMGYFHRRKEDANIEEHKS